MRTPATHPLSRPTAKPTNIVLAMRGAISLRRSGHKAHKAPNVTPTEPMFAKLHRANVEIASECGDSVTTPSSPSMCCGTSPAWPLFWIMLPRSLKATSSLMRSFFARRRPTWRHSCMGTPMMKAKGDITYPISADSDRSQPTCRKSQPVNPSRQVIRPLTAISIAAMFPTRGRALEAPFPAASTTLPSLDRSASAVRAALSASASAPASFPASAGHASLLSASAAGADIMHDRIR
mmetsp:Transcript_56906/g.160611  ORF Transcript_56906/g.160611 Transcript_56906/m.160611 type:complete len:236 (-) Transcript_56906:62-769(-)